jgi:hypothetical protein
MELPSFLTIQQYLRGREADFGNTLREFGDQIGKGRQTVLAPRDTESFTITDQTIFSGEDLCATSSTIIYHALKKKFGPDLPIQVVEGFLHLSPNRLLASTSRLDKQNLLPGKVISNKDLKGGLNHIWLRTLTADKGATFIDGAYGQINHRLNRLVIDLVINEPNYFLYEYVADVTSQFSDGYERDQQYYELNATDFPDMALQFNQRKRAHQQVLASLL